MIKFTLIKYNLNRIRAFSLSFFLHFIVLGALLFFQSSVKSVSSNKIEVVSLKTGFSGQAQLKPKEVLKKNSQPKSRRSSALESSLPETSKSDTTSKEPLTERLAEIVGESDMGVEIQGGAPKDEKERYLAEIRDQIANLQVYPRSSRVFGEQGTVKLLLTLQRNGSLTKIEIVEKAAFDRLNRAAMTAATSAAPFRSFPDEVSYHVWRITIPVKFVLPQN